MHFSGLVAGLVVLAVVLVRTPHAVRHWSWYGVYERTYRLEGRLAHRAVVYDHSVVDGALLARRLRSGPLPPRAQRTVAACRWRTTVRLTDDGVHESEFLRLVAQVCTRSVLAREREATSTVLVSTRHLQPDVEAPGCFLRTARVALPCGASAQRVADLHRRSITRALDAARAGEASDALVDRLRLLDTTFVFNKWMLDRVVRDDGRVLRLVRGGRRVSLDFLLSVRRPLELKCIPGRRRGTWTLLASPLPSVANGWTGA